MAPKKATPTESSRKSTRVVVPAPVKPAPEPKAKKAAPKKKAASKKRVESEEDEDSDEEAPPPKRARVAPVERVTLEKVAKEPKPKVEKVVKAAKLQVGDSLPAELVLQNENDEAITIGTLTADQGLIIFSYPKANTPGCTTQACSYRDSYDEIVAAGFKIIGLSTDQPGAQLSWKTAKTFQYPLLSDPTSGLLKSLGATASQKRCSWIVAKGGKLLQINLGVKPADDAANALKFIKAL